ncbi:MAG TPA: hypothetical protein VFB34_11455 [Chloroflexota bacterium]|nr:hypothetical protein [Chloroflexota bacterium]
MDKEMTSPDVGGKRDAAKRWASYVNADPKVGAPWAYLLVSECRMSQLRRGIGLR